MSLINDALKRASQSQPSTETPLTAPLQPAQPIDKPRKSVVVLLLGVLACVVVLSGWFFWKGSSSSSKRPVQVAQAKMVAPVKQSAKPTPPVPAPVATQKVEAVVAPAEPSKPAPAPEPAPIEPTTTNAQNVVSNSTPESTPAPPAPFPDLQVKAIAYHPTRATAFINDRAVGQGEEVDGVRVIKIEPNKVTVQWNGQTKELFLQ